jgi:hypothetical protein
MATQRRSGITQTAVFWRRHMLVYLFAVLVTRLPAQESSVRPGFGDAHQDMIFGPGRRLEPRRCPMSLSFHEDRALRRIERSLRRADPDLAAMLAVFSVFGVGAAMPAHERLRARLSPLHASLILAVAGLTTLVRWLGRACGAVLVPAGKAWARVSGPLRPVPPHPRQWRIFLWRWPALRGHRVYHGTGSA